MSQEYSIRDLSREFEVTTRTLRFYEEKGLLKPDRNGSSRVYKGSDRTRLKLILRGKRLGLTLDESSDIISMYDPQSNNSKQLQSLIERIREKSSQLKQQQTELKLMLLDLQNAEQRCLTALAQQT
jgi:DNA-binding transcriptional MerR regulator